MQRGILRTQQTCLTEHKRTQHNKVTYSYIDNVKRGEVSLHQSLTIGLVERFSLVVLWHRHGWREQQSVTSATPAPRPIP